MRLPWLGQDVRCPAYYPFACGCNSAGRPNSLARATITPGLTLVEHGPKCNTVIWTWLCVTRATLSRILNCHAGITAGMSLRLLAALGTSPNFWLKMQGQYDLWRARKKLPKVRRFPRAANHQSPKKLVGSKKLRLHSRSCSFPPRPRPWARMSWSYAATLERDDLRQGALPISGKSARCWIAAKTRSVHARFALIGVRR